jgi:hypothetical protein
MESGRFVSIILQEDSTEEEKRIAHQAINEYLSRYIAGNKTLEEKELRNEYYEQ